MLQLQNYNLLSENTTTRLIQYICIYISQPNSIVLFQKCSLGVQAALCAGLVKFFHIVFSEDEPRKDTIPKTPVQERHV